MCRFALAKGRIDKGTAEVYNPAHIILCNTKTPFFILYIKPVPVLIYIWEASFMGLFGNNCNSGSDSWIWIVIIVAIIVICSGSNGVLGDSNNNCCCNPCDPCDHHNDCC